MDWKNLTKIGVTLYLAAGMYVTYLAAHGVHISPYVMGLFVVFGGGVVKAAHLTPSPGE